MQLVIVESPTKSRTISKFLGQDYKVLSSYGHIRDLPEDEFGIDIEKNFKLKYVIIPKAKKNVALLKKEAEKANLVILATDEDREGEAIAYHLAFLLNLNGRHPPKDGAFRFAKAPRVPTTLPLSRAPKPKKKIRKETEKKPPELLKVQLPKITQISTHSHPPATLPAKGWAPKPKKVKIQVKNALEIKKSIENEEKKMIVQEQKWEAPAFLRRKPSQINEEKEV